MFYSSRTSALLRTIGGENWSLESESELYFLLSFDVIYVFELPDRFLLTASLDQDICEP